MGTNANASTRNTVGSSKARITGNGPLKPGSKIPAGQAASDLRPRFSGPALPTRVNPVPSGYNPGLPVGSNGLNSPRKSQRGSK